MRIQHKDHTRQTLEVVTIVSAKSKIHSPRRGLFFISVTNSWRSCRSFCWNSSSLPADLFIFLSYARATGLFGTGFVRVSDCKTVVFNESLTSRFVLPQNGHWKFPPNPSSLKVKSLRLGMPHYFFALVASLGSHITWWCMINGRTVTPNSFFRQLYHFKMVSVVPLETTPSLCDLWTQI